MPQPFFVPQVDSSWLSPEERDAYGRWLDAQYGWTAAGQVNDYYMPNNQWYRWWVANGKPAGKVEGNQTQVANPEFNKFWNEQFTRYGFPDMSPTEYAHAVQATDLKNGKSPEEAKASYDQALAAAQAQGVHPGLDRYRDAILMRATPTWLDEQRQKYNASLSRGYYPPADVVSLMAQANPQGADVYNSSDYTSGSLQQLDAVLRAKASELQAKSDWEWKQAHPPSEPDSMRQSRWNSLWSNMNQGLNPQEGTVEGVNTAQRAWLERIAGTLTSPQDWVYRDLVNKQLGELNTPLTPAQNQQAQRESLLNAIKQAEGIQKVALAQIGDNHNRVIQDDLQWALQAPSVARQRLLDFEASVGHPAGAIDINTGEIGQVYGSGQDFTNTTSNDPNSPFYGNLPGDAEWTQPKTNWEQYYKDVYAKTGAPSAQQWAAMQPNQRNAVGGLFKWGSQNSGNPRDLATEMQNVLPNPFRQASRRAVYQV